MTHSANPRRLFGAPAGRGGSTAGTPGWITSPGLSYAPRIRMCVSRRTGTSCITMTVGNARSRLSFCPRNTLRFAQMFRYLTGAAVSRNDHRRMLRSTVRFAKQGFGREWKGNRHRPVRRFVGRAHVRVEVYTTNQAVEPALRTPPGADTNRHVKLAPGIAVWPVQRVHQNFDFAGLPSIYKWTCVRPPSTRCRLPQGDTSARPPASLPIHTDRIVHQTLVRFACTFPWSTCKPKPLPLGLSSISETTLPSGAPFE